MSGNGATKTNWKEADDNQGSSCKGTYCCSKSITKTTTFTVTFADGYQSGQQTLAGTGFSDTTATCQDGVIAGPYGYKEVWPKFFNATYDGTTFQQSATNQTEITHFDACGDADPVLGMIGSYLESFEGTDGVTSTVTVVHTAC